MSALVTGVLFSRLLFLYLSTADGFRDGRKRALRRNCKKYIFFNCTVEKERNMCYNKKA